ncbi:class I adenylate-forming enzyme family protein [Zhongshania sp.]|uniref:class I adenylate-forming enzyme family protein n=1 Tax=Zhongshania sp. TaxID=1971902 RepID=UPI00356468B9
MGDIKAQTAAMSLYAAPPLAEEPGIGALSIPGYLREVSERYRDSEAVVMHGVDGVQRWTYQDLWARSVEVAKALIASGVSKGSRVGILMTNRPEYLSALFGTAMAGGEFVVLSTFSTPSEMEHMLSVSGISVLLLEDQVLKKDFVDVINGLEPKVLSAAAGEIYSEKFPFLKSLVWLRGVTAEGATERDPASIPAYESWQSFLAKAQGISDGVVEARAQTVHPADAGGVFFSSGTTSLPKAIRQSQRAFTLQFWRWPRLWNLQEPARCWTGNGFFWAGPMTIVVGNALSTGGALIMQPLFDADSALKMISAEKVTLMNGRPHQWARMKASPNWDAADFSSLRYITKGEIILTHPTANTDWELPNAFGTTETMSILSSFVSGDPANADTANFGPILPGNIIKVIDPLSGEIVPMGERGEVCIKGPTLMMGYIGKAPDEIFDAEGFHRTGDGGYIDDKGHLFWEGRLNDIIKTGGANVSPQEVDTAIAAYPGIKRTQTIGVAHETLSEMVVSCIVAVDGVSIEPQELVAFLKARLASFKVPREVLVFSEAEYPLTGNEKVKAGDLKALANKRLGISEPASA